LHRHEEESLISNNVDRDEYKEERHLSAFWGPPTCSRQEECIWALSIVDKVLDQDRLVVQGEHLTGDIMPEFHKGADLSLSCGCRRWYTLPWRRAIFATNSSLTFQTTNLRPQIAYNSGLFCRVNCCFCLLKSLQRRITASDPDANLRVSARPCTPRLTIIVIESPKHQKEVKIINLCTPLRSTMIINCNNNKKTKNGSRCKPQSLCIPR